jgi:hypothetical protein
LTLVEAARTIGVSRKLRQMDARTLFIVSVLSLPQARGRGDLEFATEMRMRLPGDSAGGIEELNSPPRRGFSSNSL